MLFPQPSTVTEMGIRKGKEDSTMKYKVDLHTHTTASDGQYSPAKLVEKAEAVGIQCLAVTDHDTIGGVDEAIRAGKERGILVLGGIEFSAREDRNMHILGLGIHTDSAMLCSLCEKMRRSREERKYRIDRYLKEKGVGIPLEEVEKLAAGGVPGRPHFARVLWKHGFVTSVTEAFQLYLDTAEYQKIERYKADAAECINAIHDAGGRAVLAHPYQLGYSDERLAATLCWLKEKGLDGLECYYPEHTAEMVKKYLTFAQKYGLYVSAGSDFHGELVQPARKLTPVLLSVDWLLS